MNQKISNLPMSHNEGTNTAPEQSPQNPAGGGVTGSAAVNFAKNDEYYTPKAVIDYFGPFDYDPATNERQAKRLGIENFDTIETDGLAQDWTKFGRIWINPPFTLKHKFLAKAVETYRKTRADIYFLAPVEFLTTKRFHQAMMGIGARIHIPDGRVKFIRGEDNTVAKSPAFGSVIIKLADETSAELVHIEY